MQKFSQEELDKILADHKIWLDSRGQQGARADLREAHLLGANLQEANLQEAYLQKALLLGATLIAANLQRANLQEALLLRANLQKANLQEANLQGAYLQEANLQEANLQEANLQEALLLRANLQEANLQEAYLRDANLEGVNLDEAINVAKKYRPSQKNEGSQSDYAQVQREAQNEIERLQAEVRNLEQSNNSSDNEREAAELQRQIEALKKREVNAKKLRVRQADLLRALQHIGSSTKSDQDLIKCYKVQSTCFMCGGVAAYLCAIGVAIFSTYDFVNHLNSLIELDPKFNPIALGLLLSLVGTASLRHDWKIRQLTAQLLKQNNKIDLAQGILSTSLDLEFLADKEGKVDESFDLVRQALLFPDSPADAPSLQEDKQNSLLQTILEAVKNNK